MEEKENVVTTTETVENQENENNAETSVEKKRKTYTRDELNKIINAEKNKALEDFKAQVEAEKTEAEKLSKMKQEEKLQYELEKERKEKEEIQRRLNARDLKDEAIKIATTPDTAFDPEFLNLIDFENIDAKQLSEKTKLLKEIQDRIVEKTINEWSKEKPPYNPDPSGTKPTANEAVRKAMGLK